MKKPFVILSCVLAMSISSLAAAQAGDDQSTSASQEAAREKADQAKQTQSREVAAKVQETLAIKAKIDEAQQGSRFVRTLTNVQVELTLTDQVGNVPPDKKTVSMVVSSGSWGKIRNTAAQSGRFQNGLNVDARPFVSVDGPIQLELTLYYYPPQGNAKDPGTPTELNQSLTVIMQSGKPLVISQAADPISDRKVIVEVKATVLK